LPKRPRELQIAGAQILPEAAIHDLETERLVIR
jgi:hypothetical protein